MTAHFEIGWRRSRRIKIERQTEVAECGLACLAMVASYYGRDAGLTTLRRQFPPSIRGATLEEVMKVAAAIDLAPRAVKLPLEQLHQLHTPAILHWDMNHFVVMERASKSGAFVHNPDGRSRWWEVAELSPHFTGIAVELRPTQTFEAKEDRATLRLSQLWTNLHGLKRSLVQMLLLSAVLQVFALAAPYYMQTAIDAAVPALDKNLLLVLAIGFGLLTALTTATSLLRSFVLLSTGTNLGYSIATNVLHHLFRLPVGWFSGRQTGDILTRFQSVGPIQQLLSQSAVTVLVDGTMAIFTLAVMFFYDVALAIIALAAFAIYGVVRAAMFSAQRDAQQETIVASGKEQSFIIESLRGMATVRMFNRETERQALWQTRMTDLVNAQVHSSRLSTYQSTLNGLIFGLENVVAVWVAIGFVIEGGFSVGMVFAYFSYKNQFLAKASSLIDQAISFRLIGLHLDRLSDIALAEMDSAFRSSATPGKSFSGRLELKNICYRHSPTDPLVLDKVNLVVEAGDYVAITGPSGGGKSTLTKIMLGLIQPESGDILVDGVPIETYGVANYRQHIAGVLQDDSLFGGSIADNITFFDATADRDRIIAAAQAASIHSDILLMPMQYETLIGDMGSSLSGGQKQRVLLARALYRRPKLLIVDEGTAFLDARHEHAVNQAIAELGVTRIIIAHREETLASAPVVYSMMPHTGLTLRRKRDESIRMNNLGPGNDVPTRRPLISPHGSEFLLADEGEDGIAEVERRRDSFQPGST